MKLSIKQLKKLVNDKYSLVQILHKNNPSESYQVGQPCYCPFHENENTPAAALYDNEGKETLYCFSERRIYTPADALENLLGYDVYEVASQLWANLSEAEQDAWLSENEELSYEDAFSLDKKEEEEPTEEESKKDKSKELFKHGKISVKDLINEHIK